MTTRTEIYPEIEPYNTGVLDADSIHRIYFEECGNPKGISLLFVHGGPGGSFEPIDRRYYDPNKWRIILFDQRGCGKSQPFCETNNNTTSHLVSDINHLLNLLGVKRAVLFGGSWGSTLALAFAISKPERVLGLVLRGIFLGTQREIDYFYKDGLNGVGIYFPENWGRYISHVPATHRENPLYYYNERLRENDAASEVFAYELARYEYSMSHLVQMPENEIDRDIRSFPYKAMSIMECHYFLNRSFMPDGYLLGGARILGRIPTSIIQGRYDMACMPVSARFLILHCPILHSTGQLPAIPGLIPVPKKN